MEGPLLVEREAPDGRGDSVAGITVTAASGPSDRVPPLLWAPGCRGPHWGGSRL